VPVVQLQDDTGSNIGSALGAAAGYFATQKQRKADKATATARQTASDQRADAAATDAHANLTSEIAARDAGAQRTDAQDKATQVSQGAYQKYFPMLSSPPTADGKPLHGPALAKALQNIKVAAMNGGMTGQQNITDFNTEVARITQADQTQNAQSFAGKEMALPGDPKQRLGVLLKRQQAERAVPGLDPKPTQDAIAATQKQITEAQAAAYQNANLGERKHHDAIIENKPQRPDHFGQVTPAQQHQWDLENKRYDLDEKRFNAEFPGGKKPVKTVNQGDTDWKTIGQSDPVKKLDPEVRAALQQGVSAYGLQGVITHLRGGAIPPGLNQTQAQKMLKAVGG
jgi:hypothetical protein